MASRHDEEVKFSDLRLAAVKPSKQLSATAACVAAPVNQTPPSIDMDMFLFCFVQIEMNPSGVVMTFIEYKLFLCYGSQAC